MPGSNNGGGGKSGDGRGPWGQGPWSGRQPELGELLKRSQDKLKSVMPGGTGLPNSLVFLVVVVVAAIVESRALAYA